MTSTTSEKQPRNRSLLWRLRTLFANKTVRIFLVVIIIASTIGVFVQYAYSHASAMIMLFHLSPGMLLTLSAGYVLSILANAWVLHTSLAFLGKKAPLSDNFLLTGYSSIVNFFGPLQSGPGVRAVYLKTKYGVRIRDFLTTSLIFYGFYGGISLLILCIAAILKWHSLPILLICVILGILLVLLLLLVHRTYPNLYRKFGLDKFFTKDFWLIGLGTLCLIASLSLVYSTELYHVDPSITIWQTLTYTAAANLAMFVSITPGAIGFREAFLIFSEKLHGISTSTILSASIIDRAFYVVFLAGLFVVILLISRRLKLSFFASTH